MYRFEKEYDVYGIIDKLKQTFQNLNLFSSMNVLQKGTYITGVNTPYGKKLNLSTIEKRHNVETLTSWEKDAYLLLLEGYTTKETAEKLGNMYPIAKVYQADIYKKLFVNTQAELIMNYHDVDNGKE